MLEHLTSQQTCHLILNYTKVACHLNDEEDGPSVGDDTCVIPKDEDVPYTTPHEGGLQHDNNHNKRKPPIVDAST